MTRISVMEARGDFSRMINRVAFGKERIVLERRGEIVAAVVPVEDLKLLEEMEDRLDVEEAERILAESKPEDFIPLKKLKKELGL